MIQAGVNALVGDSRGWEWAGAGGTAVFFPLENISHYQTVWRLFIKCTIFFLFVSFFYVYACEYVSVQMYIPRASWKIS